MLRQYLDAAMRRAHYENLPDDGSYYGEIPGLDGVWANAENLEACREELASALEDWVVAGHQLGHEVPEIDRIRPAAPRTAAGPAVAAWAIADHPWGRRDRTGHRTMSLARVMSRTRRPFKGNQEKGQWLVRADAITGRAPGASAYRHARKSDRQPGAREGARGHHRAGQARPVEDVHRILLVVR
jgi:predicted RNase H-like HicB family nuclease